jgi:hypothetical protein
VVAPSVLFFLFSWVRLRCVKKGGGRGAPIEIIDDLETFYIAADVRAMENLHNKVNNL